MQPYTAVRQELTNGLFKETQATALQKKTSRRAQLKAQGQR